MRSRTGRPTGRIFFAWLILVVAALAGATAEATTSKTLIVDVLYRADGTPAQGTLLISWPGFSTAGGDAIAAGSMTVNLGANGSLQAAVFPNTGSTPQGTYYKVLLDLDDGTRSTEYWVVPQVAQTTIAAVRSLIVPQAQAMQFVGRDYVDTAIANAVGSSVELTGAQTIAGVKTFQSSPQVPAPTNPGDAANLQFVLNTVSASQQAAAEAQATPSAVNATEIEINGIALSSSNLSDGASLAKITQIPTTTSQLTNNSGFITAAGVPVQSVNGMTGAVNLGSVATATTATNVSGGSVSATTGSFSSNVTAGPTTLNQQGIAGRTDVVDLLADCGAHGAGSTSCVFTNTSGCYDDWATVQACVMQKCGSTVVTSSPFVTVGGVMYNSACPNAPTFLAPHTCTGANCLSYFFSQPLLLPAGANLQGVGNGESGQGSNFAFPSGVGGIATKLENYISHIGLYGGDAWDGHTVMATNTADGIQAGTGTTIEDAFIFGFGRHGIATATDITSLLIPSNLADSVTTISTTVKNVRGDGYHAGGGDGGVGTRIRPMAYGVQGTSFWDTSLYGNTWLNALSTGSGTAYNASHGTFVRPYSELDASIGTWCASAGLCATVIDPQGNAPTAVQGGAGVMEIAAGMDKHFPEAVLVSSWADKYLSNNMTSRTWIQRDPDGYGTAVFSGENTTNALNYVSPYSAIHFRRTFYGSGNNAYNGSNWWCFMPKGVFNAYLATSGGCAADELTDPLRSAIKGNGLWWMPNGMLLGMASYGQYTPAMFMGVGTAAPTTGNWMKGDMYLNSAPTPGGTWGWQCTTAGTPGTWTALSFGGSGLADPGANGIIKRTALNTTAAAAASDVVALFGSGSCSGYLKSDGTCATPTGGGTLTATTVLSPSTLPACFNSSTTDLATCASPVAVQTYWISPGWGTTGTAFASSANRITGWSVQLPELTFSNIYIYINTTDASDAVYGAALTTTAGTAICHTTSGVQLSAASAWTAFPCAEGTITNNPSGLYILHLTGGSTTGKFDTAASSGVVYYNANETGCTATSGVFNFTSPCSITLGTGLGGVGIPDVYLH